MWKPHFIAGHSDVGNMLPMHLWFHLIKQSQIKLNLLRYSISEPKLSAEMALEGNYDFIKPPPAPEVTKVIIHEKLGQQKSWYSYGVEVWYLIPDMQHYRFHTV